jgi:SAM-dependent methyltransferase
MNRYAEIRRRRRKDGHGEIIQRATKTTDIPTFDVFDARSGRWQEKKRRWLSRGIRSELGRPANLLRFSEMAQLNRGHGSSIFDPCLCELVYRWWSSPGALTIDPFAGGSARGLVAAMTGRRYRGIDLRPEQIAANIAQRDAIVPGADVQWFVGDAMDAPRYFADIAADLIFTSPPFWRLERYSDDPCDLSNMDWPHFCDTYREIVRRCCALLRPGGYAVFVVGEVRGDDGCLQGLVPLTVRAFEDAGLRWHNNGVLLTALGSAPLRARRIFARGKLTPTHQHVLTFLKP